MTMSAPNQSCCENPLCASCVLVALGDDARAELQALAQIHTGGDVGKMAALLLVRQLRPLEFEMTAA